MTTPRPAAEAAEGTRPAGQAEALRPGPCTRCYADGYPACMCVVDYDEPAAGVEPPVVAVAGREASEAVRDALERLYRHVRFYSGAGASPAMSALQFLEQTILELEKP